MRHGAGRMRWPWAILLGCLAAASGCSQERSETSASPGPPRPRTISVTVAAVEGQEVRRTVPVVGTLLAAQEMTLGTEVQSTVVRILVDLGDRVERGQLLVKLDDREARLEVERLTASLQAAREASTRSRQLLESGRANVERARAVLAEAQVTLKRLGGLFAEGAISASQRDAAQTQHDVAVAGLRAAEAQYESERAAVKNTEASIAQAAAALEIARKRLQDVEVVSPIAGFVRKRFANEGETFKEKTPLIALVATETLRLQGEVPERFAPQIRIGHPVQVEVEAYPGQYFPGTISRMSPVVDVENRSFTVEASVPNPKGVLKPGFFARAAIEIGRERGVPFVPEGAVVSLAGNVKVYVVLGDTVEERRVRTGVRRDGLVEILEGVKTGETVATSNLAQLATGTAIAIQAGAQEPRKSDGAGQGSPARPEGRAGR